MRIQCDDCGKFGKAKESHVHRAALCPACKDKRDYEALKASMKAMPLYFSAMMQ